MRPLIGSAVSIRALPLGRSLALTAVATLLAAADWLPDNSYVDPDHLEFGLTVALGLSAVLLAVGERAGRTVMAGWLGRLLLFTGAIAIALAASEPLARWVFRDVTTSADNGGYFSKRWMRTGAIRRNSAGFRGPEFTDIKPPGVFRVAVVGDSFTYGNGIPQEARFTDLLNARLPSHVEVLNFGVAGANTPEHRQLVESLLPRVQPDFVLLQWYVNDMEGDDASGRPHARPLMPYQPWHRWLSDVSALYSIADMEWGEAQVRLGMTTSYPDYLHRRLRDVNGHDARVDRDELVALIARCRRAGVPLGIVLFPDSGGNLGSSYPFGYLHDRVLQTCSTESVRCIDLRQEFSLVRDHRLLWASRLDHHPSVLANEIAAVKIFETFGKDWAASPAR